MPVNGAPQETIAISDRGLAYGDGVFETILIHRYTPVLLDRHLERLVRGTIRLRIDFERADLEQDIGRLRDKFPEQGVLKIIVTRGSGGRGYLPAGSSEATRILSLHAMPDYGETHPEQGIDVFVCNQRLALQPALAGIKHLNRLEQVMAALEWPDESYMEGLMLDTTGHVIEGTRSNLFWAESGQLLTPALAQCGVAGVMRGYLIDSLPAVKEVADCSLARLCSADEVFFCNSIFGIWPVNRIMASGTQAIFDAGKREFSKQCHDIFTALLASQEG